MKIKFNKKNIWVNIGAGLSILMILYCFVYIFNYYRHNDILWHYPRNVKYEGSKLQNLSPNEIGDSIGGILNPIIGMVASILTFLAFYMQKRANDEIQAQFKVQQFESQFYEMLRLHKENVNEIEINIANSKVKGRVAFKYAVDEIKQLLQRIQPTYLVSNGSPNPVLSDDEIFPTKFYVAYNVFFWGNMNFGHFQIGNSLVGFANTLAINNSIQWHNYLGHYYRHLFSMVKFVVNNKTVKSYKDKMRYLKILRAQLSNYEQIMLFYNWLCDEYGGAWENEKNHFFTEYKMIHNLWVNELIVNKYFVDNVNGLIDEYNTRKKTSPLFEFQGDDFYQKWNP